MEEVAPMVNYTISQPSLLPVVACAPSASWLPSVPPVAVIAAPQSAPAPRVHQVQIQAELAQVRVLTSGNGINGFEGRNGAVKQMTDGARGVPPRGRPV
jgi:hypothetical protein